MAETKDIKVSVETWKEIKKYSADTQIPMRDIAEKAWKALKTQENIRVETISVDSPRAPGEAAGSKGMGRSRKAANQ
jgi:hypothetical protein